MGCCNDNTATTSTMDTQPALVQALSQQSSNAANLLGVAPGVLPDRVSMDGQDIAVLGFAGFAVGALLVWWFMRKAS